MHKWTFTLLLAALCTLPAAAQVNQAEKNKTSTSLEVQLERALTRANEQEKIQKTDSCQQDALSIRELIEQEEELAIQKQRTDFTHPDARDEQTQSSLSDQEIIEAEEELALIRNRQDINASFEKYPYLLDPAYRRANAEAQAKIRAQFNRPMQDSRSAAISHHGKTWAHKVGL